MSNVKATAGPNETADKMEEQRKESIRAAFKGRKPEKSEETSKKSEEKLDKEEKNDYINKEGDEPSKPDEDKQKQTGQEDGSSSEESSKEDQLDEYERILQDTFGGDERKAVKSWKESQKSFAKLQKKSKEDREKIQALETLVENNPVLEGILNRAVDNDGKFTQDDLQNFLQSDRESKDKPTNTSNESKPEIVDTKVDEKTLAEEGLLDLSQKDLMSSSEWNVAKRQAALKYLENNLPANLAKKAYSEFKQQIEAERKQQEEAKKVEQNRRINEERYEKGIETIVDRFNLDFAGNEEHLEALDKIEQRATYIRDPENPSVIRPNAMYLATVELIEEGELDVGEAVNVDKESQKAAQKAEDDLEDKMGFNKSPSSTNEGKEPTTIAEKLRQRRLDEYEKELSWRKDTDRIRRSS